MTLYFRCFCTDPLKRVRLFSFSREHKPKFNKFNLLKYWSLIWVFLLITKIQHFKFQISFHQISNLAVNLKVSIVQWASTLLVLLFIVMSRQWQSIFSFFKKYGWPLPCVCGKNRGWFSRVVVVIKILF